MTILSYIADYETTQGIPMHGPYQVVNALPTTVTNADVMEGAKALVLSLLESGMTPSLIVYIPGRYTMRELGALADGPPPPGARACFMCIPDPEPRSGQEGKRHA